MPHVVVKMFPGPTEAQKASLADAIVRSLVETVGSREKSISVAIEEVQPQDWMTQVYASEIGPHLDQLYKKPGYGPT